MKVQPRLIAWLGCLVATVSVAQATGVVIRAKSPLFISGIVASYPTILAYDVAGASPFARFEVNEESKDALEAELSADSRVDWAEDEDDVDSPENQSSHGSSLAAIYDRKASYGLNTGVWQQIRFSPVSFTSKVQYPKVGIVDTGVSPLQPSILSRVVAGDSFVANSPTIDDYPTNLDSNNNGTLDDGAGHGTMVAGIILQLCPNAQLIIAKSADSDGMATSWSVLKGVVFCVENGAKLINISLGSPNHLTGFSDFLDWVDANGALIISPIGNNSANMTLYPGGYSKSLCATGLLPDNTKAPFSNWNSAAKIAAPATGIMSAWWDGKTAVWSGTSFSAPLVTGSIAAASPYFGSKRISDIRKALLDGATNIDAINPGYQGQIGKLLNFSDFVKRLKTQ